MPASASPQTAACPISTTLGRHAGAFELALIGRVLTADEALVWGLVTEVVDEAVVHERAARLPPPSLPDLRSPWVRPSD
jgi:enoyl-CoA hydratase/carnithine racemase